MIVSRGQSQSPTFLYWDFYHPQLVWIIQNLLYQDLKQV